MVGLGAVPKSALGAVLMPAPFHDSARHALPNLTAENYRITSPTNWRYNCIAWAVGITDSWWWPAPGRFWPPDVPRDESLEAFIAALATRAFISCSSSEVEVGVEKIALYLAQNVPTHAARQLSNGWWTSKLGPNFDIEHANLEALAGGVYGDPVAFLGRHNAT
jgi:hypothetical protein